MQAITRRRLSKVDAQYSNLQTLAAVIGREIDTQLLAHVHDATTVQAWLSNAAEYGVLTIQDNSWRFAHDKLREAILTDIPDDDIPSIHRTAAETIEAVYSENEGYNEALLTHWQHTGNLDKTYQYLLPVVEDMVEIQAAYHLAQENLKNMLDRLPDDDPCCVMLWNWLGTSAWKHGDFDSCKYYAGQARQLAAAHNDRKGLAKSLLNLGIASFRQAEYRQAAQFHQQSLSLYQQLGEQNGIADNMLDLGNIAFTQGDPLRAMHLFQQSLALYLKRAQSP